ncbi:MAG: hypothetical protein AVO35_03290 [Candidatus Aegiribacteria sp. MLS_C]|nr:MAG: hypothetical protein AVO35_03290 [Candidatus Aegiribacteria sp. MLS_C]
MMHVGVDYGRSRTGFAVCLNGVVMPREPLLDSSWDRIAGRLLSMEEEAGPVTVVLGLPLSASGRPTELSREVEGLAGHLRERGFEVETVSEVGSSEEASDASGNPGIRNRRGYGNGMGHYDGRLDSMAAMVILKRYLGLP